MKIQTTKRCDNVSGFTGVCWRKRDNRWHTAIIYDKHWHWLGSYPYKFDAIAARMKADEIVKSDISDQVKHLKLKQVSKVIR